MLSALPSARKTPPAPPAAKTVNAEKSTAATRAALQLLRQEDGELTLEWKCPEIQLERDPVTHRIAAVMMNGADPCQKTGVPTLPQFTQLLDCLPGKVTAQVVDMEADTRLLGEMIATPEDIMVDAPPASDSTRGGQALDSPAERLSWSERASRTPLISGMWPPQVVSVQEAGVYRGHRLMSLNIFPVQVDAQRGVAHVVKRIKVRVTMPRNATAVSRIPDQASETDMLRKMLGQLAPTALATRMPEALEGRGASGRNRLDDFDPLHPRWKIIVSQRGIVRVTATDLRFAGCPVEQITAREVHLKNRGHEVPIYFSGEEDNRFDDGDYFDFYGIPNQQTYQSFSPSFYQDPWTNENVYWLSWGDGQPGLRLANEDGTYHPDWSPQQVHQISNVQTSLHFEADWKFDRLQASTSQFAQTLLANGPLGIHQDHWFWGTPIEGLSSRSFLAYLPFPATSGPEALYNVTVRACLQGYTFSDAEPMGNHRAIVYVNGRTAPGLQGGKITERDNFPVWKNQTPIILQTRPTDTAGVGITAGTLEQGNNVISVSLPGDGLAGANDKVMVNWFEIDYARAPRASYDGSIYFPFDTTRGDTYSFEIRGFATRNISVWKLDHARLTNVLVRRVNPADESPSWAARFQLISDGAYQMALFDDRYPQHPAAIVPETSNRDLRTLNGARYLIIYHDSFANDPAASPWLQRLDSLRRVTFDGSVDTIRVSQIYEQFNDGIVNPEAIRNFLKYAYEHWAVRPTHCCLVGDGVMENKYSGARQGDLISSLYTLTTQYGATAADMLFGCVSGPPWDILPDIAVGRISCRSATELESYVRKLIAYEDPSRTAYNSLYHCTMLAVADKKDAQFDFPGGYSEPTIQTMPDEINVSRVYLDSLPSGQGPNVLRDGFRNGAVLINYNGHGGGGVWSGTNLMDVAGVRQLNNRRAYPFITNFTCYVGAFDAINQADVLGEAFEFAQNNRLDPVGGIGVYSSTGVGWANAGRTMQQYLYDFCATVPGLTLGEIVQINKTRFWGRRVYNWAMGDYLAIGDSEYSMMMMMTLLGDPGVKLALPQQTWHDVHANTGLVHLGDTLRVSGTLPWDPAGQPTDVYLLPYNGAGLSYYLQHYRLPNGEDTAIVIPVQTSHVPALNLDLAFPQQVTTREFSNLPVPISAGLHTLQGHVVVYAVNQGSAGVQPQDAIGTLPLFLADSLTGLQVFSIQLLPLRNVQLGNIEGFIPNDSTFQVQVNLMNPGGIARVKARGVFRPAQGPVTLDTLDLVEQEPGLWRTPDLGPYSVYGGSYRMQFFVQPATGGEFVSTDDYNLTLEARNDYLLNSSAGVAPKPVAGKEPAYYVPLGSTNSAFTRNVDDLPVRMTAVHDCTYTDATHHTVHVVLDSIATTIHINNISAHAALFDTLIPTYFWPQFYRITLMVDPDNIVPEINESNNTYTTTLVMPNLFPATNALGTYMPRTTQSTAFHYFYKPGLADTIWLKVMPGSLPVDSTTLIYTAPRALSAGELAQLSYSGLSQTGSGLPDTLRDSVYVFRVTLADSSDALVPGGVANVSLNFSFVRDSLELSELALFERRDVATAWRKLDNLFLEGVHRDTTFSRGVRIISFAGKVSGTASDLGNFALFRYHDEQGPQIQISVDGMHFTPHSILPRHPQIFANLTDPSGIDRSAGKFGIILDGDTLPDGQIVWSDSLVSNAAMSALIRPNLDPGHHVLRVFATDNTGMADSTSVEFEVSGAFGIEWAINYPNPFPKTTTIAYLLTDVADNFVECKIFTVSGRYIRTVREVERAVANYREITWDGRDDRGNEVANGVYFARLRAKQGKTEVEKMVKLAKVR
ncbi:MAG TPA: C25 family cysteine peptidase [bacterium]